MVPLARKERRDPLDHLVQEGFLVHQAPMGCQDPWVPQVPHLWTMASL